MTMTCYPPLLVVEGLVIDVTGVYNVSPRLHSVGEGLTATQSSTSLQDTTSPSTQHLYGAIFFLQS